MPNYINIYNTDNTIAWQKALTNEELIQVKGYLNGRETIPIFFAALKPIRTNNLTNFIIDFTLPTTINHAINVQNIVGKIFAILAALIFDLLTLPIRLFTFIPRIISNAKQPKDLLHIYLVAQGINTKLLALGHATVELVHSFQTQLSHRTADDGVEYASYNHWVLSHPVNYNFIEVPVYEDSNTQPSRMKWEKHEVRRDQLTDLNPLINELRSFFVANDDFDFTKPMVSSV